MEWLVFAAFIGGAVWIFQHRRTAPAVISHRHTTPEDLEPDDFTQEVVGESHHQESFEKICGPRCEDGEARPVIAMLVPESGNRFDANAVKVVVQGLQVGYLPKEDAKMYRKMFGTASVECDGMIVGGWDRSGKRGHYGIRLAFRDPDEH